MQIWWRKTLHAKAGHIALKALIVQRLVASNSGRAMVLQNRPVYASFRCIADVAWNIPSDGDGHI